MSWADLLGVVSESPVGVSDRAALYTMLSAVLVTVVGTVGTIVIARYNRSERYDDRRTQRTARQHEAWERFLIAQNFDPRKIRTGYETPEEVLRAVP